MKKMFALVLSLVMLLTVCLPVYATEGVGTNIHDEDAVVSGNILCIFGHDVKHTGRITTWYELELGSCGSTYCYYDLEVYEYECSRSGCNYGYLEETYKIYSGHNWSVQSGSGANTVWSCGNYNYDYMRPCYHTFTGANPPRPGTYRVSLV